MQRIERYGVIALVFLLVTILAVSLWSQKKGQSPFSFFKKKAVSTESADLGAQNMIAADPLTDPAQMGAPLNQPGVATTQVPVDGARPSARRPNDPFELPTHGSNTPASQGPLSQPGTGQTQGLSNPATIAPASGDASAQPSHFLVNAPAHTTPASHAAATQKKPNVVDSGRTYVVRSGDTLSEIAARELGSVGRWEELSALNGNLDPRKVRAGMKLKLPAGGKSATAAKKPLPPVGGSYVVRRGDTLSEIALRELGSTSLWDEIALLNPGVDPARLQVGEKLKLPSLGRAVASAKVSANANAVRKGRVR